MRELGPTQAALFALASRQQLRTRRTITARAATQVQVAGHSAILTNFASNDYLGLSDHLRVKQAFIAGIQAFGAGATAAPLVCGHSLPHEQFEAKAAAFVGADRALLLGSGYLANLAILSAFATRNDTIFADKLNHACLNDGALLSRATVKRYPHANLQALEQQLAAPCRGQRIIASDTVFSMDGAVANLTALVALARRYDAWLVLDDAHGLGVLGRGHGSLAAVGLAVRDYPKLLLMATLGKAVGVCGAFVAGHHQAIEWLMQTARPYLFATGLPAGVAFASSESLDLIDSEPHIIDYLQTLIAHFQARTGFLGHRLLPSYTAIQPIILGDNAATLAAQQALTERGFWVPAIRPPTVPPGTARLRVSLSAAHTVTQVDALIAALQAVLPPLPLLPPQLATPL